MRTKSFVAIILFIASFELYATCACERVSLDLAIDQSKNIFSAKVRSQNGSVVHLEKLVVYKGEYFPDVGIDKSPCPVKFKNGSSYIFLLDKPVVRSTCEPHFEINADSTQYKSFLTKIKK